MQSDLDDSIYEKYKLAGKISGKARDLGSELIKEGNNILEVVNKVESKILKDGGKLAFPVNISINEVAAHFSPHHEDNKLIFKKGDVVKLDVGAHVGGYIADTAITIEVGTNIYNDMIKASREALKNAIDYIRADTSISEVGNIIEETIKSYGYKSIDNLTGHSLERYSLHSGVSIPNIYERLNLAKIKQGDVLAIEPFATDGAGHVVSGEGSNIYRYVKSIKSKLIRDSKIRLYSMKINKKFNTLPFAERWCKEIFPNIDITLKKLLFVGCIRQYPQLIDEKKGIVTQAEHTIIINEDNCEVTT
jgi:methionyl aminopeptidase